MGIRTLLYLFRLCLLYTSSERADNVAIYLEEQVGIPPKKLICRGYGKY